MCAIIGVLGKSLPSQEQFIKSRDTMTHRGPDDAGLYYAPEEGVVLGHRRLSIIDLSADGRQPFFSHDGRFVMVYNGEIYNYLELKNELESKYDFKTKTDTEVLLAAYIAWGAECLQKLNGMFAFAIWDKKEKRLFCARDRLGEKPFFYSLEGGTFRFSSEIKGLRALGVDRSPNEKTIFDYLRYGLYDHSEETFFSDIKRLPAGHCLVWKNDKTELHPYWSLKDAPIYTSRGGAASVEERFREILSDAIATRFRSDVSVGLNLSSGLDSNALLYFSKKILGEDVHSFSFCYDETDFNECARIQRHITPEQRKYWHTEIVKPNSLLEDVRRMNRVQGEPFGGIPTLAHDHLFRMAKEHDTTVILEGQGGDEILGGYEYYRLEYEKDKKRAPLAQRASPALLSQDSSRIFEKHILSGDFLNAHGTGEVSFEAPFSSHLQNAQYRDIVHAKLPRVLRFHDHMSMAYGRELRLPFLDYRLVEFCFSLPAQYKIDDTSQKVLIRSAMKEYLPEAVKETEKKTFSGVQNRWFRHYYQKEILELLNSDSFKKRPYWNHGALMKKVDSFLGGVGDNSFFLWQCVNLELWFKEFVD